MAPATAQSLSFESEGNAGNTDKNFREIFAVESLRRLRRLEDSVRTARQLGAIADASRHDHASRSFDARLMAGTAARPTWTARPTRAARQTRIEDGAARHQRVRQDSLS